MILRPLGMSDSGFFVPASERHRLAEPFAKDPDSGAPVSLIPVSAPPQLESGGGGLVSTAEDYLKFLLTVARGGSHAGGRLLSRKTIEWMSADHLGGAAPGNSSLLPAGYGFGLGFAVRREAGLANMAGCARRVFLGRRRRNDLLRRSAGAAYRPLHDAGAGAARLFPHPVPQSRVRRDRRLDEDAAPRQAAHRGDGKRRAEGNEAVDEEDVGHRPMPRHQGAEKQRAEGAADASGAQGPAGPGRAHEGGIEIPGMGIGAILRAGAAEAGAENGDRYQQIEGPPRPIKATISAATT